MQPTKPYRSEDLHYLKMLARQYPNVQAASTEIVNLQAIRNLQRAPSILFPTCTGNMKPSFTF